MEIELQYGRTVNAGDYESERVGYSITETIEDPKEIKAWADDALAMMKRMADADIGKLKKDQLLKKKP